MNLQREQERKPKSVPFSELKKLSKKYGLTHLVLLANDEDGVTEHVTTYGKTVEQCAAAADMGNELKDSLGWPERLHQTPSRVKKIKSQATTDGRREGAVKELEQVLNRYDIDYQRACKENGWKRETPRTVFHRIVENRIKELE